MHLRGLPPSDNNAYRTGHGRRRFLVREALAWKRAVGYRWLESTTLEQREGMIGQCYTVKIWFGIELYTKAGEIRRWDHQSHVKLTLDALAEAMDSDDRHCMALTSSKGQDPEPRARVRGSTSIIVQRCVFPERP